MMKMRSQRGTEPYVYLAYPVSPPADLLNAHRSDRHHGGSDRVAAILWLSRTSRQRRRKRRRRLLSRRHATDTRPPLPGPITGQNSALTSRHRHTPSVRATSVTSQALPTPGLVIPRVLIQTVQPAQRTSPGRTLLNIGLLAILTGD
jgi:hypothetical protein